MSFQSAKTSCPSKELLPIQGLKAFQQFKVTIEKETTHSNVSQDPVALLGSLPVGLRLVWAERARRWRELLSQS